MPSDRSDGNNSRRRGKRGGRNRNRNRGIEHQGIRDNDRNRDRSRSPKRWNGPRDGGAAELSQRLANAMTTVYKKVQEMDRVIQSVVDNKQTEEGKRMFELVDDALHHPSGDFASHRATRQADFPVDEYWAFDQKFGPVPGLGSAIDRDLTIQEMLELGANPNVRDPETGDTALHIAAKTLIPKLADVLCNNDFQKADETICNKQGKTPSRVAIETRQQFFHKFPEDDRHTNVDIWMRTFLVAFVMPPDLDRISEYETEFGCNTCMVSFQDYNSRRKVAGLAPISEKIWDEKWRAIANAKEFAMGIKSGGPLRMKQDSSQPNLEP